MHGLHGQWVRVVTRRGHTLVGELVDAWKLRNGGLAVSIQTADGLKHTTTLQPVVAVDRGDGSVTSST